MRMTNAVHVGASLLLMMWSGGTLAAQTAPASVDDATSSQLAKANQLLELGATDASLKAATVALLGQPDSVAVHEWLAVYYLSNPDTTWIPKTVELPPLDGTVQPNASEGQAASLSTRSASAPIDGIRENRNARLGEQHLEALLQLGDEGRKSVLRLARHKNVDVAQAAIMALGLKRDAALTDELIRMLDDGYMVGVVPLALVRTGEARARTAILRAWRKSGSGLSMDPRLMREISGLPPEESAADLASLLRSKSADERAIAFAGLLRRGEDADIDAVLDYLLAPEAVDRQLWSAAQQLDLKSPGHVKRLGEAMDSSDADVVERAIILAGRVTDPTGVVEPLSRRIADADDERLMRIVSALTMQGIGRNQRYTVQPRPVPAAVDALASIVLLPSAPYRVREAAAGVLVATTASLTSRYLDAYDKAARAADSPLTSPEVLVPALAVMGNWEGGVGSSRALDAIEALAELNPDPSDAERAAILLAQARVEYDDAATTRIAGWLRGAARGSSLNAMAWQLVRQLPPEAALAVIIERLGASDKAEAGRAAGELGRVGLRRPLTDAEVAQIKKQLDRNVLDESAERTLRSVLDLHEQARKRRSGEWYLD